MTKGATIEIPTSVQLAAVFDPESIQVLVSALDDAWSKIEKSGGWFARPAYSRAIREVIAKRIIEMAQQGMNDPHGLADDAVRFLSANYSDHCKA